MPDFYDKHGVMYGEVNENKGFYKNIYDTPEYKKWAEKSSYAEAEQYLNEEKEIPLPDGYSLFYRNYMDRDDYRIRARFGRYEFRKDGKCLYEYTSIYDLVPFEKFIEHSNGHRYYPFHVDLYGISFIDVDTLEVYNYIPYGEESRTEGLPYGESFIIVDVNYDPETNLVAYEGCYWACYYDVMVGDLSDPLHFDPHLISVNEILYKNQDDLNWENLDFSKWSPEGLEVIIEEKEKRIFSLDLFKH